MPAIKFCVQARLSSAAILHAAQLIDDHARSLPVNAHAIRNVQQELNFLVDMTRDAYGHLDAIADGSMSPAQAKELK